jgi:glutamate/tyrosine decarboxylase-like PLP-dependent enzyme
MSPAAVAAEETAIGWCRELLGLPETAAAGLTTGAQMANVTALAAARNAVLARAGWDVEAQGLLGAPAIRVIVGGEAHATLFNALRLIGLGRDTALRVPADAQGRMRPDALAAALADGGAPPTIVCAQAGNVNTGAFDPLDAIAAACRAHGAWLHIDGAFGLWAAAAPRRAHLVAGAARADSWAVDAHKWLNVPYDAALAFVADPAPLRAAVALTAPYLTTAAEQERNNADWSPEASRRARAFPLYAALRQLGRHGVAELVERHCVLAARIAERLATEPGVAILNDVVLNQVLARFGDDDAATDAVVARVQADGTCWLGGTRWRDVAAMRISVSGWQTTEADADRSAEAIVAAWRAQ